MAEPGEEFAANVLSVVARFRVGRVLLWLLGTLLGLLVLMLLPNVHGLVAFGAILLVVFLTILAFKPRKKKSGGMKWLAFRLALTGVALGVVALLLWLRGRRGKVEQPLVPPPLPEEVDQLARLELEAERVA